MIGNHVKGFEPAQSPTQQVPPETPGKAVPANQYIRCPLPPFNAMADTLRQFNEGGKTPTRRVIPLPIATAVGGSQTIVTNTSVTETGGGGGSTPATLTAQVVVVNAPVLSPGGVFQTTVQMAKSFQVLSINSTTPIEVRLYGTANAQSADVARVTDTAVPFEIAQNVIIDVVFDTTPFSWNTQNIIGANADSPQSLNIYISVVNPSQTAGQPATVVTIQYLPLES